MTAKTEYRLWDSQWVNVVNSPGVLDATDARDAVHEAVKLVERYMAENFIKGDWPPSRAAIGEAKP